MRQVTGATLQRRWLEDRIGCVCRVLEVVGKVRASATPTPGAIPWLLLDATPAQGDGMFSRVVAIQRLATESGLAPASGCNAASAGSTVRVPYKAVYRFYTTK